ncbi:MAG: YihY/virulence factor BrkB family protein [Fluviicola sp.]
MIKNAVSAILTISKSTISGLFRHGILTFAASIAFYTIFSLPGLLITVTMVAGIFIDKSVVESGLVTNLESFIGEAPAETIGSMLKKIKFTEDSIWKTIFGLGTLLFSATTIFISLQESLNRIWDVRAVPKRGWLKFITDRVISFGMVLAVGFLMMVSLLLDTLFEVFFNRIENMIGSEPAFWLGVANEIIFLIISFSIICLIFKMLPDVILSWRDVAFAALITVGLLYVGKFLIGLYIGQSDFSQTYDAAGSLIIMLMWVYYSSVVLLTGAEVTRSIMIYKKRPIRPANGAKKIRVRELDFEEYKSEILP